MTLPIFSTTIAGTELAFRPGEVLLVSDAGSIDGKGDFGTDGGFPDDLGELIAERAKQAGVDAIWDLIVDTPSVTPAIGWLEAGHKIVVAIWINDAPDREGWEGLLRAAAAHPNQVLICVVTNADSPAYYPAVDRQFTRALNANTKPGYRESRVDYGFGGTDLFLIRDLHDPQGLATEVLTA